MNLSSLRRVIKAPSSVPFKGRIKRRGAQVGWTEYFQTWQQGYRIADTGLDLYELYVGEDAEPDFDAAPNATSATLPFAWSPTPPGSGTLQLKCVVRKRNRYNLQSFNVMSFTLEIDSVGTEVLVNASAPQDVSVYDAASGALRVIAKYVKSDDSSPADTWEVYVTEGSDPVPGVDTPAYSGLMEMIGEEAFLGVTVTGYTLGATAHVIVTAMRSSDSQRTSAAAVQKVLAESLDLTDGLLFGGTAYEPR